MKRIVIKSIAIAMLSITSGLLARAEQYEFNVSGFTGVSVADGFKVTMMPGDKYMAVVDMEPELYDFVSCTTEGSILKLIYDEKKIPKEIRQAHDTKKKVFEVKIYVPNRINSIKLSGKSVLRTEEDVIGGENISIQASNQAVIDNLTLDDSGTVNIILEDKSNARISASCKTLMTSAQDNSTLDLTHNSEESNISASGSSNIVVRGETTSLSIESKDSSKSIINGKTSEANYTCSGLGSDVNVSNLTCEKAVVNMKGSCKMSVGNVSSLEITLTGGATLNYSGDPVFKIKQIKSSNVNKTE